MQSQIFARLKQSTQAIHKDLEAAVNLPHSLHSVGDYRNLLERFHILYALYEVEMRALATELSPWLPDIAERMRTESLCHDLRRLGDEPSSLAAPDVPRVRSVAQAWGCLYVLEGSTLGGQIISRHLADLAFIPSNARSFFAGYGSRVGEMWTKFKTAVEGYSQANPQDDDAIVASAVETFQTFYQQLSRS